MPRGRLSRRPTPKPPAPQAPTPERSAPKPSGPSPVIQSFVCTANTEIDSLHKDCKASSAKPGKSKRGRQWWNCECGQLFSTPIA
jgi:hypothetical protein